MSEPFELLSAQEIGKWLAALEVPGQIRKRQKSGGKRITLYILARYLGLTRDYLHGRARDQSYIGLDRRRLISKAIAQIEHGELVVKYDWITRTKTLVPVEGEAKPLPPKYAADFSGGAPALRPVPRVKPLAEMPDFGKLLTKRK